MLNSIWFSYFYFIFNSISIMNPQLEYYKAYLNTHPLWNGNSVYGFEQFQFKNISTALIETSSFTNKRLGKLIEQFVFYQLQRDEHIRLLEANIQIKDDKLTIGELDALLIKASEPIHLEIIYKFYLYDTQMHYEDPLAYWIGPNRSDKLLYKLDKLKTKQLPLLQNPKTITYLEKHNLTSNEIKQQLCFKAQLFLPYAAQNDTIALLNENCIVGWHLSIQNVSFLKNLEFYIPSKLEWLLAPKQGVEWLDFVSAKLEIMKFISQERSPLCWVKDDQHKLQKCFITFW